MGAHTLRLEWGTLHPAIPSRHLHACRKPHQPQPGLELSPPLSLLGLLIHSCINFHLDNSMGDCQILARTKFNLQAVLCPLSTCLLFKTLMKRLI